MLLISSCSREADISITINDHLDKEISDRINKIDNSLESTITQRWKTYVNPNSINDSVTKYIQLAEEENNNEIIIKATNYFNRSDKYYDIDNLNFIKLEGLSKKEVVFALKMNELSLLDNILLGEHNRIGKTFYQAQCIPTSKNDSMLSFDVILLKIDTIRSPQIRVKMDGFEDDSVYIPIVGGKGLLDVYDQNKDFVIETFIDCKIRNKDTSIIAKYKRAIK